MNPTPVLIKACLNGARPAGAHPSLPLTPGQLAEAAAAVRDAGAGAIHMHPRDADGRESLAPGVIAATVSAVREACPGVPVGVTTGAWIMRDVAARLEAVSAWEVLPDFASVNWSEQGAPELAQMLLSKGLGVEAGLFTGEDATAFAASPLAYRSLRALVEVRPREPAEAVEAAARLDQALVDGGVAIPILHHGLGEATWAVLEAAFGLGRDVRIGLEDTFALPDGAHARDNAALVAAAVRLARECGREPAGA